MKVNEQGAQRHRHTAIPRTLIFVTSVNPATGAQEVLLLKGAPTKRLWAGLYNGLGGHVEAGESVLDAARREFTEETGLEVAALTLRGVVHAETGADEQGPRPGILIFVFRGTTQDRAVRPGDEGTPEWIPLDGLAGVPLVSDLPALLPRALGDGPIFFGHYAAQPDGTLDYRFT